MVIYMRVEMIKIFQDFKESINEQLHEIKLNQAQNSNAITGILTKMTNIEAKSGVKTRGRGREMVVQIELEAANKPAECRRE